MLISRETLPKVLRLNSLINKLSLKRHSDYDILIPHSDRECGILF